MSDVFSVSCLLALIGQIIGIPQVSYGDQNQSEEFSFALDANQAAISHKIKISNSLASAAWLDWDFPIRVQSLPSPYISEAATFS